MVSLQIRDKIKRHKINFKIKALLTPSLYEVNTNGRKRLTKEMHAARRRILTNRSSNCSTTNSQMLFPETKANIK